MTTENAGTGWLVLLLSECWVQAEPELRNIGKQTLQGPGIQLWGLLKETVV